MSYVEFTGRTLKEAVKNACEELKVEEGLLDIEVMEESTKGFLGIVGQRNARIRVRRRDILKEVMEADDFENDEEQPDVLGRLVKLEPAGEKVRAGEEFSEEIPEPETPEQAALRDQAKEILAQLLEKMSVPAQVETRILHGAIYLDIRGDGSGLLIGKNGQTLNALQFIVNKMVNKSALAGEKVEIIVDTENYRRRKTEKLKEKAMKLCAKAKNSLKPAVSDPMPAGERRIIHLILAEDRDVYTKSYGEEPRRRIIVYPRRGAVNKRRGR
ncbi:MAG: KH domain-containing protein [Deltaproteobacteria bacterium]|nr:KH domain-containing protein [Deltaproteobacteria bacterium]